MKMNYSLLSRSLIALLFVVAGYQKLTGFAGTSGYVGSLVGVSSGMLAMILTALVIVIEIPVALAYAWGYRVCITGGILVAFTIVTTVLAHRDFSVGMNMIMALKNIAIIGGILATTGLCSCNRCSAIEGKA